jgi:hypothetical protein
MTSPTYSRSPAEAKPSKTDASPFATAGTLPTPLPSTEISAGMSPKLEGVFALPPAAMVEASSKPQGQAKTPQMRPQSAGTGKDSKPSSPEVKGKNKNKRPSTSGFVPINDSDYRPPKTRNTNTTSSRRDSVTSPSTSGAGVGVQLPSPPTRARRIIQMKPPTASSASSAPTASGAGGHTAEHVTATQSSPQGKRKSGGKSAASKKTARKTAHSLIERRRRSKMNEEFATLKNLVPACEGVEMHKLAILQASIDYVRYLKGCIEELKKGGEVESFPTSTQISREPTGEVDMDDEAIPEEPEEEESEGSDGAEEHTAPISTTSSIIFSPEVVGIRSGIHSNQCSPSWTLPSPRTEAMPSALQLPRSASQMDLDAPVKKSGSAQGEDYDQRTAEALLMLNTDRREWNGKRGMSVKDLLTSSRD